MGQKVSPVTHTLYPLLFAPIYQDYLWGGTRIRERYGRAVTFDRCAESWELCDRPEGQSVVRNGPLAGAALSDLLRTRSAELMGPGCHHRTFPLLIKILDAKQTLSVQVHPDNHTAALHGGEAKTEMWCVLDAAPSACVYAGLRSGTDEPRFRQALNAGDVATLLTREPVSPGDAIFIPGGRMHAVGAGCLILEVQQNSNTTYRVFDWNRVGSDGKPRALQVDAAMQVTRWVDPLPSRLTPAPLASDEGCQRELLAQCPYFTTERWNLRAHTRWPGTTNGARIVFAATGRVRIQSAGGQAELEAGTTCLIPATCMASATVVPMSAAATLYVITPGDVSP